MTLSDAIKHCEEVAEENYGKATECLSAREDYKQEEQKCVRCADEHMQLAEWLKDYKRLLEQQPTGHWIIMGDRYIKCSKCGHITKTESPDIYHFCMVCGARMIESQEGDWDKLDDIEQSEISRAESEEQNEISRH